MNYFVNSFCGEFTVYLSLQCNPHFGMITQETETVKVLTLIEGCLQVHYMNRLVITEVFTNTLQIVREHRCKNQTSQKEDAILDNRSQIHFGQRLPEFFSPQTCSCWRSERRVLQSSSLPAWFIEGGVRNGPAFSSVSLAIKHGRLHWSQASQTEHPTVELWKHLGWLICLVSLSILLLCYLQCTDTCRDSSN